MNVSKNQSPTSAIEMWIKSPVLNVVYTLTTFITLAAIAMVVVSFMDSSMPPRSHFPPGSVVVNTFSRGEAFLKLFCTMSEVFGFGVGALTLIHAFCVKEMRVPSRGPHQIIIEKAPRLTTGVSMIVGAATISYVIHSILAGNANVDLMSQNHACRMQLVSIQHHLDSSSHRLRNAS